MTDVSHYDYELPRELIAQQPLPHRADARLLVVNRSSGTLAHRHVRDLPDLLEPADAVVLNDTRVIPARLVGRRTQTGGRWEGLFLRTDDEGHWRLLSKTRGKLRPGEPITLIDRRGQEGLRLWLLEKLPAGQWLAHPESEAPLLTVLDRFGRVPLPPYIRGGEMLQSDWQRYQTVFAARPGSVAAPTAGLHLTTALLDEIARRDVALCRVTLHVGPGTFRPMTARRVEDHVLDAEWGALETAAAETLLERRAAGGRIVAVGTTSVRVLESAAGGGRLQPWSGWTDLLIRPGYQFAAVDALLTNFHLPRSSLLMLARTFGGDELIRRAYQAAIDEQYRFYSYGDAMLIV